MTKCTLLSRNFHIRSGGLESDATNSAPVQNVNERVVGSIHTSCLPAIHYLKHLLKAPECDADSKYIICRLKVDNTIVTSLVLAKLLAYL